MEMKRRAWGAAPIREKSVQKTSPVDKIPIEKIEIKPFLKKKSVS